jgi:choline dehydrogenase-like flavoprotein
VTLAAPDPFAPPRIDPQFLTAEADRELLRKGARIAHRILAAEPLARYGGRFLYGGPDPSETELDDLIRDHSDTIYHPVGTCRMGADSGAVLDPALRVRGIDGLRVADASVMPAIVSGNTQAPSAMIGEKAADLILGRAAV